MYGCIHCGHCDGCPWAPAVSALWFLAWPTVRCSITEWSPQSTEALKGVARYLSLSLSHSHTHARTTIFDPFKPSTLKLSRAMRVYKYLRLSKHVVRPCTFLTLPHTGPPLYCSFFGRNNVYKEPLYPRSLYWCSASCDFKLWRHLSAVFWEFRWFCHHKSMQFLFLFF